MEASGETKRCFLSEAPRSAEYLALEAPTSGDFKSLEVERGSSWSSERLKETSLSFSETLLSSFLSGEVDLRLPVELVLKRSEIRERPSAHLANLNLNK